MKIKKTDKIEAQKIFQNSINLLPTEQSYYITLKRRNNLSYLSSKLLTKENTRKSSIALFKFRKQVYTLYKYVLKKHISLDKLLKKTKFKSCYRGKNFYKLNKKTNQVSKIFQENYFYLFKKYLGNCSRLTTNTRKKLFLIFYLLQVKSFRKIFLFEKKGINFFKFRKKKFKDLFLFLLKATKTNHLKDQFKALVIENGRYFFKKVEKLPGTLSYLDKKNISKIIQKLILILFIYFLPFIFLATDALVPNLADFGITTRSLNPSTRSVEKLPIFLANPFSSLIFKKIPFLIELIKLFYPIATNKNLQLWAILLYLKFFVFDSYFSSKVRYNGTIAYVFVLLNYACYILQSLILKVFDSIRVGKDILFLSYLVKHLNKNKNKDIVFYGYFKSLTSRYLSKYEYSNIIEYFNFIVIVSHRIFSPLAFISLVALLYNCLYYLIWDINPEIFFITQAARGSMKKHRKEE